MSERSQRKNENNWKWVYARQTHLCCAVAKSYWPAREGCTPSLPARILSDLVNTLGYAEVSLHLNGTPDADLRCGTVKAMLKGIDAADYPSMPTRSMTSGAGLEPNAFREMLHQVIFAASTDPSRPILNGVLLEMDGRKLTIAATDAAC